MCSLMVMMKIPNAQQLLLEEGEEALEEVALHAVVEAEVERLLKTANKLLKLQ